MKGQREGEGRKYKQNKEYGYMVRKRMGGVIVESKGLSNAQYVHYVTLCIKTNHMLKIDFVMQMLKGENWLL